MTKYIALFRGVNVGGRSIKMPELRACFAKLGFPDAQTLQASGNVTFESDETNPAKLRAMLEAGVSRRFGYEAVIFVYPADKIAPILKANPFAQHEPTFHSYIIFFDNDLETELARFRAFNAMVELFRAGDGVLYWTVQKGMTLQSALAKEMNKPKYQEHHTVRNANTLHKLIK
jgi:uncharacterized protein (DUF1697 family)